MIPSEERLVSVSGKEVLIRKIIPEGKDVRDPWLIFLHEGLGSVTQWKEFPQRLAEECGVNVVLYDRPGYGRSEAVTTQRKLNYLHQEADFLYEFIQTLDIKKFALLGHSEGGSIALIFASRRPEGLQKVITLAANTRFEDKMLPSITEVRNAYEQPGSKLRQALEKHHGDKTDAVFYRWSKTWTAPFFKAWNIREELKQITVHLLAVHGDNDQYSSSVQMDQIAAFVPSAQTVMIQQCSHHPHVDHPGKVTALVCDFLKTS